MGRYQDEERLDIATRNLEERRLDANILCAKCKHGHVFRRIAKLELSVYCTVIAEFVPYDIAECNGFEDKKTLTKYEMQQIALDIDPREGINNGSYR